MRLEPKSRVWCDFWFRANHAGKGARSAKRVRSGKLCGATEIVYKRIIWKVMGAKRERLGGVAMTNETIARKLRDHATELARAGDNLYRVRAFRRAAMSVLELTEDVAEVVATGGPKALERVPGIGRSLADTIAGLCGERNPPVATGGLSAVTSAPLGFPYRS